MSLRQSAKQAMLWSAGLSVFRDVLQFGQMLVMARLLDPVIYGMAGMATTVIGFISLASFQHVVVHVLQQRPDREVNYHEHFTAGLVLNGSLFVLANIIAVGVGFSERFRQLQPLLHLLSLTFLLSVPVDLRVKMLERDQNWHRLRSVQMAAIVISVASGIAMAAAGAGVYSLVVPGLLASSLMTLDLFLFAGWRPHLQWNYGSYRETVQFGLNRAGSNAMNGGRALLQNSLITHNANFAGLGLFSRAEGLAHMFCGRVAQQVTVGLYPVVTRAAAQSDQFRRISGLVLSGVAWFVVPIGVFFSLQAASLVHVLYGQKWLAVAPLLPLAMGCGVAISIGATAYSLLLANDQSRLCLRSDTAAFFIAALPMVALIPLGLQAYLAGALVASVVIAAILVTLLVRTRGLRRDGLLRALTPPVVSAVLAAITVRAIDSGVLAESPEFIALLACWLAFTVVYVLTLRFLFRAPLTEIVAYLPGGTRIARMLRL
jgi:PST family polysaccharide transporter